MKKQYIVQKYVMADSVQEALKKQSRIPVHEIYIHNQWFEKQGFEWVAKGVQNVGFKRK